MLDLRELTGDELPLAEERLRAALDECQRLVERQPTEADYAALHAHIAHRLASLLNHRTGIEHWQDPRGAHEMGDEARRLAERAVDEGRSLVERFPESVAHRFWLARFESLRADIMLAQHRPDVASLALTEAIAALDEAEPTPASAVAIESLRERLKEHLEAISHLRPPPRE